LRYGNRDSRSDGWSNYGNQVNTRRSEMYQDDYLDGFENPYGYPEVGVQGQRGVSPDFMEKSGRYGGHPVSFGAGIVNDPNYQDSESDINKSLRKQMLAEQLRSQGFDVAEATVQPYIDEHMVYMTEQTNVNEYGEPLPPFSERNKFDSQDLFPPMPGYHLSYFANMAFYIPEAFGLDNVMTNAMWLQHKESFYMRYLVLTLTYIQLIPIVGRAAARGTIAYAMKPNVAFPNKLQVASCKEPLPWLRVDIDDFTGHGNKLGILEYTSGYGSPLQTQILQGTGSITVKGVDAGISIGSGKGFDQAGLFDDIRRGSESVAREVENVLKRIFKDYDIIRPKKGKRRKKSKRDPIKEQWDKFWGG